MSFPENWWSASPSYVSEILSLFAAEPDRDVAYWRGEAFSGGDLIQSVTESFLTLQNCGVGKGDVVAILVEPNSPEMLTVRYATYLLGGAVCYLRTTNPGTNAAVLPPDQQIQILRDTEAVTIYADAENSERALELADGTGIPVTRLHHGECNEVSPLDVPALPDAASWDPDALVFISFSSGSTGRPKGIRSSARAWQGVLRAFMDLGHESDCASVLLSTPLSHAGAPMADAAFILGGAIYLHESFDAETFVQTVSAKKEVSWTFMATTHVFQLIDYLHERGIRDRAAVEAAGLSSLKRIVYGGSPAAPVRTKQAFRTFGPVMVQWYASGESYQITTLRPSEHGDPELAATVGRPYPGVEVVVCNSDSGEQLAVGEIGEIRVRSPQLMDGYTGDPELTARALRDGWYFTGDIGFFNDRGYLTLVGRVADVIKVDGVKVHPTVVEAEILSHPGVRHAAVYGVRDEDGGEHIHAAVECDPNEAVDAEDIRARITAALSSIHAPEKINFLSALPMNSIGKPDRVLLRSQYV
ncbi:AMP-binding protein [Streptomyces sp. NEAU-S7GS2]|uniref:class I adenylate-forming enzyme family protein n=1 Tax=Streptomyces sp. NEAU-S7GS2 TaxID=2202000 RepID=UPI000D6FB371|nr:AMP-binding protein [Streptomyces sp. NEAU-S7GS2]AWN30091.1 fatty acid--CoA ligase [Streptomyces sp. NEAU-S7GS2]